MLIREDEFVVSRAQKLRSTRALIRQFLSNNDGKEDVVQGSHNVDIDMGFVENKDMGTECFELEESDNCDVHVAESGIHHLEAVTANRTHDYPMLTNDHISTQRIEPSGAKMALVL